MCIGACGGVMEAFYKHFINRQPVLTENLYNSIANFNPSQITSINLICLIPFLQLNSTGWWLSLKKYKPGHF